MIRQFFQTTILSIGLFLPIRSSAETWNIDPSHSNVGFEVEHMMISTVKGNFGSYSGTFETNSKGELVSMSGVVHIKSVDTNDKKRDGHLQTPDFFDAEKYPKMEFQSSQITGSHKKGYKAKGNLTIKGVTRSVTFKISPFKGPMVDGWGNTKVGLTATTTIDRQKYGISWNNTLDAGGLVVGNEVLIVLNMQLIQQK